MLASDIAAGLSARLDAGLVVDAVELHNEDGRVVTRRPGLGDSVFGHCAVREGIAVVVARSNAFAPGEATAATAPVERMPVAVHEWSSAARVVGHEEAETGGVDITAADILVAGGRGLGSADGFRLCEELARALGGEVAATLRLPGRPDGQDGQPEAVRRLRYLGRDPAQGGDERQRHDRRDQQGPERADLRLRRPRRRRRPCADRAEAHRAPAGAPVGR